MAASSRALLLAFVAVLALLGWYTAIWYTHGGVTPLLFEQRQQLRLASMAGPRTIAANPAPTAAAAVAVASGDGGDGGGDSGGGCGRELRPYHVLITSSSGTYQAWQTTIMYYHVRKQKAAEGACTEIGGITRLLTMPGGRPDAMTARIPTYVVRELLQGSEDHGFVVMNRPHSVQAFVRDPAALALVREDYIFIAETDHVWLRPIANVATPSSPLAFHFGYMEAHFRAPLIERFCAGGSRTMDPVGPSPLIIHRELLAKLVGPWLAMSHKLKTDPDADQQLGWVLEMWGYSISAACLGVKHIVSKTFQFEGGSIGTHERSMDAYGIFHYTYGIEYSVAGVPMELQVGDWSLDKRHYGGAYPRRELSPPPRCAEARARLLRGAYNEASAALTSHWPNATRRAMGRGGRWESDGGGVGPDTWKRRPEAAATTAAKIGASALGRRLIGTGPWRWAGPGCCGGGRADKGSVLNLFFLRDGVVWTELGTGSWALRPLAADAALAGADAAGNEAKAAGASATVTVTLMGVTSVLAFSLSDDAGKAGDAGGAEAAAAAAAGDWSFEARLLSSESAMGRGGDDADNRDGRDGGDGGAGPAVGRGLLRAPAAVLRRWAAPVPEPPPSLLPPPGEAEQLDHEARLEGSGFYRTWGCLLRAGVAWRGRHGEGEGEWQLWRVTVAPATALPPGRGGEAEWGAGVVVRVHALADSPKLPTRAHAVAAASPAAGAARELPGARAVAEAPGSEGAGDGTGDGIGELTFDSCWAFVERRNPRRRHEWIMPQPAKRATPGCTVELAKQRGQPSLPADALAQRLLASGTWAWADVPGMRFNPEGLLITPWGQGAWGLVPGQPRLAHAQFAGQTHILDLGAEALAADAQLARFTSTRCSDGEKVAGRRVAGA